MKNLAVCLALVTTLVLAAFAQQPAMQSSAVTMRGKNISLKYTPLPVAGKKLAGVPIPFHTDVDLEIQGLPVPKGDYSLFVVPGAGEWTLIVSKQTGAAAATHNPKMDLGRVQMDMKKAAAPSTALQVKLATLGSVAGKLELTWESTVASVPFNLDAGGANPEW